MQIIFVTDWVRRNVLKVNQMWTKIRTQHKHKLDDIHVPENIHERETEPTTYIDFTHRHWTGVLHKQCLEGLVVLIVHESCLVMVWPAWRDHMECSHGAGFTGVAALLTSGVEILQPGSWNE